MFFDIASWDFPVSLRGSEATEAISKIGDCVTSPDERLAMTVEYTNFM